MRFSRILLSPYGSHERTEIALGPPGALDVIYGPNEAGKSTLRRAIVGLLFGIDERTPDTHRFQGKDLRITADLLLDGASRTVTRKKGRKATLVGETGAPIDEAAWARALGGVTREAYERGFGLDHELLRTGAAALLSGDADLGESLLSASTGVVNLGRFRNGLRESADELYSDKAKKKPLNEALVAYAAKRKNARDYSMNSEEYVAQKLALALAETERDMANKRRAELATEKHNVARTIALGSLFLRRRALASRLLELGPVPHVTEEAARARAQAEETLNATLSLLDGLRAEESSLSEAVASQTRTCAAHAPLAHVDADEFLTRRGAVSMDRREHAQKETELWEVRKAVATLLAALPGERPALSVGALASMSARLAELGHERGRLHFQAEQERVQLARIDAELAEAGEDLRERSASARTALDVSLAAADLVLERSRELPRLRAELLKLREELAALPLARKKTALPDEAALGELAAVRDQIRQGQLEVEREIGRIREHAAKLDAELGTLASTFAPPSEADLQEARAARDALLAAGVEERLALVRDAVARADALADRMRRESEQVSRRARLAAEKDAATTQAKEAHAALSRFSHERSEVEQRHRALFVGIEAPDPAVAKAFVRDARRALLLGVTAAEQEASIDALEKEEIGAATALAAALDTARGPLRALLDAGREQKAASESAESVKREREEHRARRRREKAERTSNLATLEADGKNAQQTLEELTAALSLQRGASVELALQKAAALREIAEKEEHASALEKTLALTRARIQELDGATEAFFAALALPTEANGERRAQTIAERLRELTTADKGREQAEVKLADVRTRRVEAEAKADASKRTLDAALRHADAKTYAELPAIEEKSRARLKLEAEKHDLDLRISEAGGAPATPIVDREREAAQLRLPAIEDEQGDVEKELHKALGDIGGLQKGITDMEREVTLSLGAQAEAEQELAKITDLARRYARLVLTGMLLDERIVAHREENENDVLTHASAIVARITGGSIKGLEPSYQDDEHPVLVCVRPDGKETPVAGLSDGTKDALYLSLRIASLSKLARRGQALPVLLDDVLIHMDDDRAKVAMTALADLAKETQVLFFTHHKRMVELCEAAVPKAVLRVGII